MATWRDPAADAAINNWNRAHPEMGMPAFTLVVEVAKAHGGFLYDGTPEADAYRQSPEMYQGDVRGVIPAPSGYKKLPLTPPATSADLQASCSKTRDGYWNGTKCLTPSSYGGDLRRGFDRCVQAGGVFQQTGTNKGRCFPAGYPVPSGVTPYVPPLPVTAQTTGSLVASVAPGAPSNIVMLGVGAVAVGGGLLFWLRRRRQQKALGCMCPFAGAPKGPKPSFKFAQRPTKRKKRKYRSALTGKKLTAYLNRGKRR